MQFEIGDLVRHKVWVNDIFVITGFNQRNPIMPEWCNNSVRFELVYSLNDSKPYSGRIRYSALSMFEDEFEALKNCVL